MPKYRVYVVDTISTQYIVDAKDTATASEAAQNLCDDGVEPLKRETLESYVADCDLIQ